MTRPWNDSAYNESTRNPDDGPSVPGGRLRRDLLPGRHGELGVRASSPTVALPRFQHRPERSIYRRPGRFYRPSPTCLTQILPESILTRLQLWHPECSHFPQERGTYDPSQRATGGGRPGGYPLRRWSGDDHFARDHPDRPAERQHPFP